VLAYLSRYTHRVAIANSRLIACDDTGVTFRWKDYRAKGRERHKVMTLTSDEFIRRFLIHVLPSGFHRIRHYGLFANGGRAENLARARELLGVSSTQSEPSDTDADASPMPPCPCCGGRMIIIEIFARLNAAHPSREPDQDRHIMMPVARAPDPITSRICARSSTGGRDACADAGSTYRNADVATMLATVRSSATRAHPHATAPRTIQTRSSVQTTTRQPTPLSP
jgi:Putative transposase